VFTSEDVIVSSQARGYSKIGTPRSALSLAAQIQFAWSVQHQGFVSSSAAKRYQIKEVHNFTTISQRNTKLPHNSSSSIRIGNGTQTQCPRTHTLLDSCGPILLNSLRSFSLIKSFPQIKQQSEPAANRIRNMAELFGYDAAEDEAD
jgi:hypothetical protein